MKEEPKLWREQVRFRSEFVSTGANDRLTLSGILRFDEGLPNAKPSCVLEFFGDCENEDGELVKRKRRYNITPAIAADIVDAMQVLARFENDRPPEIARERFREAAGGFVVSRNKRPTRHSRASIVAGGWKFERKIEMACLRRFVMQWLNQSGGARKGSNNGAGDLPS